jgi:hypothetical protein
MRQKLLKKIMALVMALIILTPVFAFSFSLPAMATSGDILDPWGGKKDNIKTTIGLGERDPRDIAASVIKIILGFLGIVAVIIILLGGFKWMTAGGNEDKVGEAKKLIIAGVIGLIIIIAAFAIATFVLNQLMSATTVG